MTRLRFAIVALLVLLTLPAVAKAVDKKKLRRAISLPEPSLIFGYGMNIRGEFTGGSTAELAAVPQPDKFAEIEKEMKGDASDAERYSRLATLYFRARQPAKGKEARHKAVALFRKQLEQHPDDTAIQLRLANALDDVDKSQEAETLVRRVVQDDRKDWHAWLVLGEILDGKSRQAITGGKPAHPFGPEALLQAIRAAHPTPETIAAARQHHQEALACFDRAVRLAPGESEVYRRRAASRYHYGFLDCGLRFYEGKKADSRECSPGQDAIPDLRRAVALNCQEYKGIGLIAGMEAMTEFREHHPRNGSDWHEEKLEDALSESTRKRLRAELALLEKGTQNPDKHKAAEAAEVLGSLQILLFQDDAAAEKSARRSIELDPSCETAWDILVACLLHSKAYQDAAAVCQQRLKRNDSPRNRSLLAKTYEHLKQLDKAEEVVRAGLKREPHDFMLRVALADLLMICGGEESLSQAGQILDKLREEKNSASGPVDRRVYYMFAHGIFFGLIDAKQNSRAYLKAVQKRQPDYPGIADALKALDEEPEKRR